jgi:hypothetical protein
MFWCNNCNTNNCIIDYTGKATSFNKNNISKRINNSVRLHSSLHLMEKATQTVNGLRPTFKTQSDRFYSKGVDKKHNSYARYLARKKGKTICCCACTQLVTRVAGITASSWPDIIPIGASIFGAGERQGIVIAVNKTNGEIKSFIIRSKYCITPYPTSPPSIWSFFVIPTSSGSNTNSGTGVFMGSDPEALKIINYCK